MFIAGVSGRPSSVLSVQSFEIIFNVAEPKILKIQKTLGMTSTKFNVVAFLELSTAGTKG